MYEWFNLLLKSPTEVLWEYSVRPTKTACAKNIQVPGIREWSASRCVLKSIYSAPPPQNPPKKAHKRPAKKIKHTWFLFLWMSNKGHACTRGEIACRGFTRYSSFSSFCFLKKNCWVVGWVHSVRYLQKKKLVFYYSCPSVKGVSLSLCT